MENSSLPSDVFNVTSCLLDDGSLKTNILNSRDLALKVIYVIIGIVGVLNNLFVIIIFIFFIKIADKVLCRRMDQLLLLTTPFWYEKVSDIQKNSIYITENVHRGPLKYVPLLFLR